MLRNQPNIDPKSIPKRSPKRPGSHGEAQGRPRAPKSAPRSAQNGARRAPESLLGPHRGAYGATRGAQRPPKEGQRASESRSGRRKIEPEALAKAKTVNFDKNAPRPAPADTPDTSEPSNRPKINPKSIQGAPSNDLLGRLRPLEDASSGLSKRLGATRAASGAPRGRPGSLEPARRARYFRDAP